MASSAPPLRRHGGSDDPVVRADPAREPAASGVEPRRSRGPRAHRGDRRARQRPAPRSAAQGRPAAGVRRRPARRGDPRPRRLPSRPLGVDDRGVLRVRREQRRPCGPGRRDGRRRGTGRSRSRGRRRDSRPGPWPRRAVSRFVHGSGSSRSRGTASPSDPRCAVEPGVDARPCRRRGATVAGRTARRSRSAASRQPSVRMKRSVSSWLSPNSSRQPPGRDVAPDLHLPHPLLGVDVALGEEQVVRRVGGDVGDAAARRAGPSPVPRDRRPGARRSSGGAHGS